MCACHQVQVYRLVQHTTVHVRLFFLYYPFRLSFLLVTHVVLKLYQNPNMETYCKKMSKFYNTYIYHSFFPSRHLGILLFVCAIIPTARGVPVKNKIGKRNFWLRRTHFFCVRTGRDILLRFSGFWYNHWRIRRTRQKMNLTLLQRF